MRGREEGRGSDVKGNERTSGEIKGLKRRLRGTVAGEGELRGLKSLE